MAGGFTRVTVWHSDELQAVILALRVMDREVAREIRARTKSQALPIWREEIARHAKTKLERRVLVETARAVVNNQTITVTAGQSAKRLRGGARISDIAKPVEFGHGRKIATYTRRHPGGNIHTVRRQVGTQFKQPGTSDGVAYPAFKSVTTRVLALWVQTVVRTMHETLEKATTDQ